MLYCCLTSDALILLVVCREEEDSATQRCMISRKKWSSIVYRQGQKQLSRLFLREAEHALQLALSDGN